MASLASSVPLAIIETGGPTDDEDADEDDDEVADDHDSDDEGEDDISIASDMCLHLQWLLIDNDLSLLL